MAGEKGGDARAARRAAGLAVLHARGRRDHDTLARAWHVLENLDLAGPSPRPERARAYARRSSLAKCYC